MNAGRDLLEQHQQRERRRISEAASARLRQRCQIVALSAAGATPPTIGWLLDIHPSTVGRWIARDKDGEQLFDHPRSGRPSIFTDDIRLRTTAFYCQTRPLPNSGRWTLRWAACFLKKHPDKIDATPSKSTIHRILQKNRLKPHRSRYFLQITDPNFFPKMEHLVSLYMNPPDNLYFFDECPGIQILKRLTPDLQTDGARIRLEEFEYIRNGTMDVFAFLTHSDGTIYTECHGNHKTETFLEVFRRHVAKAPAEEPLHYVMDNLSCHSGYRFCQVVAELCDMECPSKKTLSTQEKRTKWLGLNDKRIVIHFTPYHGSWLNFVEIWFGIMGRKVLRESFGSPDELKTAFDAFVEEWNLLLAHPFNWSYDGDGLHELAVKRFTEMLREEPVKMDIRILTKELLLMTNLLSSYYSEVSDSVWKRLVEKIASQFENIEAIIEKEEGHFRKKKAQLAVERLVFAVNQHFGIDDQEKAA